MRVINAVKQWKVLIGIVTLMAFVGNADAGRIFVQFYGSLGPQTGSPIEGTSVEDLINHPDFPDSPGVVSGDDLEGAGGVTFPFLNNGLEWPPDFETGDFSDNYGTMAEGYLYVPQSGEWKLFVRSDDASQLEFNPNGADPEGAEIVAEEPGCCNAFMDDGTRSSDLMTLETGTAYYFRILHKEGQGGDWFQVGWDGPGVNGPRVIRAPFVQEFTEEGAPEVTVPPSSVTVTEGENARFSVGVSAVPPVTYSWSVGGDAVEGADGPFVTLEDVGLDDDGATVAVEVSNDAGEATAETMLSVTADTTAPWVLRADPRGNPNGVTVFYSEPVSESSAVASENYEIDNGDIGVDSVELIDDSTVRVNTAGEGFAERSSHTIEISDVEDLAESPNAIDPNPTTVDFTFGGGDAPFYPDVIEADNAVRYWRLDETDGNTAFARVAGEDDLDDAHGTYSGGPTLGAEGLVRSLPENSAVNFDSGTNVDVPNGDDINVGGPYLQKTIEMWIRPDTILGPDEAQGLWEQGGGTRGLGFYLIENEVFMNAWNNADDGDGAPWGSGTSGQDDVYVGGGDIQAARTYHVVGVMDGVANNDLTGTLQLYVNGELVDETEGVGQLFNHGGDVDIADVADLTHADVDNFNFDGTIDDVSLYNTALSADQVQTHFEAANTRSAVGPITITQAPEDLNVIENESAIFTLEVAGARPHTVEWLIDGEPAQEATSNEVVVETVGTQSGSRSTLRIPRVIPANDGIGVTARLSNRFSETTTESVSLGVDADTTPPSVSSVGAFAGSIHQVRIQFDELLDEASATNPDNYTIEGTTIEGVELSEDGTTVTLSTSELPAGETITVQVENVSDNSAAGNSFSGEVSAEAVVSYAREVLVDNPVRYWRLGESSGGTAVSEVTGEFATQQIADASYGGGTELGVPGLLPGSDNTAVRLFGGQEISIPNSDDINTGEGPWTHRTVELWFQMEETPSEGEGQVIYEEGGATRGISMYLFGTGSDTEARLYFNAWNNASDGSGAPWGSGTGDPVFVEGPLVQVGQVIHAMGVMDGDDDGFEGQLLLFVNGQQAGQVGGAGQVYNHAGDVGLGASGDTLLHVQDGTLNNFIGLMDEVALYNSALTEERALAHFQGAYEGSITFGEPTITVQPDDQSVPENGTAEFAVEYNGTPPWDVTWRKNGEVVDAASVSDVVQPVNTFTFPATADENGTTVSAEITNREGRVESEETTLTVELDETAPEVVQVRAAAGGVNRVIVRFNELLDEASATDIENYAIEGLEITGASLRADGQTVVLETAEQTVDQDYTLEIDGVKDQAAAENAASLETTTTSMLFYPEEVLVDAPIRYWKLAESSDTVAASEITGTAPQAAANGAYGSETDVPPGLGAERLVLGSPDTAVEFNAAEGHRVVVPSHADIDTGDEPYTQKTIELWFKAEALPTTTGDGTPEKHYLYEQGGAWRGLSIYLSGTESEAPTEAELIVHAWNNPIPDDVSDGPTGGWGGESDPLFVSTSIEAGETYHAVLVMDGDDSGDNDGGLSAYLNGEEVGSESGVGQLFVHGNPNAIGAVNGNTLAHDGVLDPDTAFGNFFDGVIDEVALYNSALSAERVAAHYEAGISPVQLEVTPPAGGLDITLLNGEVEVTWEQGTLETAPDVAGPWEASDQQESPATFSINDTEAMFFRLAE